MRHLLIMYLLILSGTCLFAQKSARRDTIIRADTINVRGVVYGYDGKPVSNMNIMAQLYNYREAAIKTDADGYFEFKGANPKGGLRLLDARYYNTYFPFNGNRYLTIYLPQTYVVKIQEGVPVTVNAKRTYPKVIPSIKEETPDPNGDRCFDCGIGQPPIYPQIIGNRTNFMNVFRQNLVYPQKAIENNIEGIVEIEFTVEKEGTLANFKVLRGIGYGCDEEVISLLKKSGKWRPGIYNGRPVILPMTFSVEFKLTDK